jgi:voltage-gated potassium channel
MENHVIVCGYGRVGQKIADDLAEHGVEHVVVDHRAEALDEAMSAGNAVVHGDATEEQVLQSAHIERARALVAAADSDVGNTYIVLTARSLNPDMFIVARAGGVNAEQRMISAGANRVISPYQMAGFRMALSVVQPLMLDFVDVLAARRTADEKILAEIVIGPGSSLCDQSIAKAFDPSWGLSLLGVEHAELTDGEIVIGPTGSEVLHEGDRLMVYGSQEAVEQLSARQMAN